MDAKTQKALFVVDGTYEDLMEFATDIFKQTTNDIDEIMSAAYDDIEKLSNDAIRDLMLRLSLKSYTFSEIKEKATFKAVLAETIRKEEYAKVFNNAEGTVAVRENSATIGAGGEILAEEIYTLVAGMLKTKLDEIHRVVNTLQTVLMTRMQEAKLTSIDIQ
jgi:hypothetical protein